VKPRNQHENVHLTSPVAITPEDLALAEELLSSLGPKAVSDLLKSSPAAPPGLMEFVPFATPGYDPPTHLQPIVDALEDPGPDLRLVISVPPQHSKTVTATSGLVRSLMAGTGRNSGYVTYSQQRAEEVSRATQWMADRVSLAYEGKLSKWGTRQGSILWTGIGGALTGSPIDGVLIVDDPVKNREEAESRARRDYTDDWFRSVALTRLHPGAACVVIQTRWHEDDLAGRLVKRGWKCINLPAIDPRTKKALWEARRPLKWLRDQEAALGEYDWQSLYLGEPRPGGLRFFDPDSKAQYVTLPDSLHYAIGVDVATSDKTTADYSAIVVIGKDFQNVYYIVHVERHQLPLPNFLEKLKAVQARYPSATTAWHVAGKEHDVAEWFRLQGAEIHSPQAKHDKGVRAYSAAAAWSKKALRVPMADPSDPTKAIPWVYDLLNEMYAFTGSGRDAHDDQVDALSSAISLLPLDAAVIRGPYDPPEHHPAEHDPYFRGALAEARKRQRFNQEGMEYY
jgi:predicted phage terminase large subunit-like protein